MLLAAREASGALIAGSVKGNVGHTESASGMMGLAKLLCGMCRGHGAPNAQLAVLAGHVATALGRWRSACLLAPQLSLATAGVQSGTCDVM